MNTRLTPFNTRPGTNNHTAGKSPDIPYVNPDFRDLLSQIQAAQAAGIALKPDNILERRALLDPGLASSLRSYPFPSPEDIVETKTEIKTKDYATITVSRFATPELQAGNGPGIQQKASLAPAILWAHGGGMTTGSVETWKPVCLRYVEAIGVQIFAVDYRLAPENPAPGPVKDFYAALEWLSANSELMHVDPANITLWGESAGGGIVAGTALLARDKGLSPPLARQILIYPMLDDRTKLPDNCATRNYLTWSESDNRLGWCALLGEARAGNEEADVSIYDAPGRVSVGDLVGLPSTYIDLGTLDLFLGESLRYAAQLLEAGVEIELHTYPGVPHAFEALLYYADNRTSQL
ncbi:hypothetical protein diail_2913 [Diaporthe ilicicola]|nr:hypothetical protein diail_2913 [Diaporthe ilicicola]